MKDDAARQALAALPYASAIEWLSPATSSETAFRTKAKLVVGGTPRRPTLGTLDHERAGVDLPTCRIQHPAINSAIPALKRIIRALRLQPYDITQKRGELKYIHINVGTDDALMLRFVLRSRERLNDVRAALGLIRTLIPSARVISANIHPRHEATLEGPDEIILTKRKTVPLSVGDVELLVGPRSFVQTNTHVAGELYRQVSIWAALALPSGEAPHSMWDLYCGVGGFALSCAARGFEYVTGVELSHEAIASAREAAKAAGIGRKRSDFLAADATEWARTRDALAQPDVVVVNPPRRGIGSDLANWINESSVPRLVYSSCNPLTLAQDLEAMPAYRATQARLFDMFPHTSHAEVAVVLHRA